MKYQSWQFPLCQPSQPWHLVIALWETKRHQTHPTETDGGRRASLVWWPISSWMIERNVFLLCYYHCLHTILKLCHRRSRCSTKYLSTRKAAMSPVNTTGKEQKARHVDTLSFLLCRPILYFQITWTNTTFKSPPHPPMVAQNSHRPGCLYQVHLFLFLIFFFLWYMVTKCKQYKKIYSERKSPSNPLFPPVRQFPVFPSR